MAKKNTTKDLSKEGAIDLYAEEFDDSNIPDSAPQLRSAPDKPVLSSSDFKTHKGKDLTLTFNNIDGATLEAQVDGEGKGSVRVEGFNVIYTPHNPSTTEEVDINVKAVKDGESSEYTVVSVKVVVTELKVSPRKKYIKIGEIIRLDVETNADDFNIQSDNASVKASKENKTLTGVSEGNANITVTSTADGGEEATVKWEIECFEGKEHDSKLYITPKKIRTVVGRKSVKKLKIRTNDSDKDLQVTFDTNGIASFDKETNTFTGISKGVTVATFISLHDGDNPITEDVIVEVIEPRIYKVLKRFQKVSLNGYVKVYEPGDEIDISNNSDGFEDYLLEQAYIEPKED